MFDAIDRKIERLSQQMELFNVHYITKLDEKFITIMQIVSGLDANVKQLAERAQAWDTFNHHMNAWSDYIKSSHQKMEIVKNNLENLPIIQNQLQNTDFKVQHIFEKTDLINEKLHEVTKSLQQINNSKGAKKKEGKVGGESNLLMEGYEIFLILSAEFKARTLPLFSVAKIESVLTLVNLIFKLIFFNINFFKNLPKISKIKI